MIECESLTTEDWYHDKTPNTNILSCCVGFFGIESTTATKWNNITIYIFAGSHCCALYWGAKQDPTFTLWSLSPLQLIPYCMDRTSCTTLSGEFFFNFHFFCLPIRGFFSRGDSREIISIIVFFFGRCK